MSNRLCATLRDKIEEQIERTIHLIRLLPAGSESPRPLPGSQPVGHLLGHIPDCVAGFCAVLVAASPDRLAHFNALRSLPVHDECDADHAIQALRGYRG